MRIKPTQDNEVITPLDEDEEFIVLPPDEDPDDDELIRNGVRLDKFGWKDGDIVITRRNGVDLEVPEPL